ncbi:hypothetical protein DFJ74DRAFT_772620, partial [Hyaloraphidium curvatum]
HLRAFPHRRRLELSRSNLVLDYHLAVYRASRERDGRGRGTHRHVTDPWSPARAHHPDPGASLRVRKGTVGVPRLWEGVEELLRGALPSAGRRLGPAFPVVLGGTGASPREGQARPGPRADLQARHPPLRRPRACPRRGYARPRVPPHPARPRDAPPLAGSLVGVLGRPSEHRCAAPSPHGPDADAEGGRAAPRGSDRQWPSPPAHGEAELPRPDVCRSFSLGRPRTAGCAGGPAPPGRALVGPRRRQADRRTTRARREARCGRAAGSPSHRQPGRAAARLVRHRRRGGQGPGGAALGSQAGDGSRLGSGGRAGHPGPERRRRGTGRSRRNRGGLSGFAKQHV